MAVNGHFANIGENGRAANFEHGIQVIDEDKEFKYVLQVGVPLVHASLTVYLQMYFARHIG